MILDYLQHSCSAIYGIWCVHCWCMKEGLRTECRKKIRACQVFSRSHFPVQGTCRRRSFSVALSDSFCNCSLYLLSANVVIADVAKKILMEALSRMRRDQNSSDAINKFTIRTELTFLYWINSKRQEKLKDKLRSEWMKLTKRPWWHPKRKNICLNFCRVSS
jgi:hypothetical protein